MLKNKKAKAKKPEVRVGVAADVHPTKKSGWTIIDANEELLFQIKQLHITLATCKDPTMCVIAQALRAVLTPLGLDGFIVGSNITKIINFRTKTCIRYSTPHRLANALRTFDKTGEWGLPPDFYTLRPLAKSYRRGARFDKIKHSGGVQSKFRGRAAAPTRHAETVCQLARAA